MKKGEGREEGKGRDGKGKGRKMNEKNSKVDGKSVGHHPPCAFLRSFFPEFIIHTPHEKSPSKKNW
jgi:hypothetical protein